MAGASLLTLLDDIATLMDDVSVMTKVAAKKTVGVLGDDLALNAQQVVGVSADRELPVVWAVAKGSLRNKLILVPAALLISALLPWLIMPLLMLGGAFLCVEGFEKVAQRFFHSAEEKQQRLQERKDAMLDPQVDMAEFEREKVKGAIRTDFILSAEIIAIALGVVAGQAFLTQVLVLSGIALLLTVFVYGAVAGIVKIDDLGLYMSQRASAVVRFFGRRLLALAPYLMRYLTLIGTVAMFMMGGGILLHGLPAISEQLYLWARLAGEVKIVGEVLEALATPLLNGLFGVVVGAVLLLLWFCFRRLCYSPR